MITALPAVRPVTWPAEVTAAMPLLLLVHDPPAAVSVKVAGTPTQSAEVPVIVPAFGNGLMIISAVAIATPQPLFTV